MNLKQFKQVVFDPEDEVCVGKDCYENGIAPVAEITAEHQLIQFFSINALVNSRANANVSKHRTFLVECDSVELNEQQAYIDSTGMPYSTKVFSGGKSYHYLIVLEDVISAIDYVKYSAWIHSIMSSADKATKDAARFSRWPGVVRTSTGMNQALLECKGRISNKVFLDWLGKYAGKEPVSDKWVRLDPTLEPIPLNDWVKKQLLNHPGPGERNSKYLSIAGAIKNHGVSEEDCLALIADGATFSLDFTLSELRKTVSQAYSYPPTTRVIEKVPSNKVKIKPPNIKVGLKVKPLVMKGRM